MNTNTNIQIKYTNIYTDHPRPSDHSINGSWHNKQTHEAPNRRRDKMAFSDSSYFMLFKELA